MSIYDLGHCLPLHLEFHKQDQELLLVSLFFYLSLCDQIYDFCLQWRLPNLLQACELGSDLISAIP